MDHTPGIVGAGGDVTVAVARESISSQFRHYRTDWEGVRGWLSEREAEWLFEAAKRREHAGDIVEIGSAFGRSTVCLAWGARVAGHTKVYSVDPHTGGIGFRAALGNARDTFSSWPEFSRTIARFELHDVVVPLVETSEQALARWSGGPIRLVFVDGWHTYEAVRHDILGWSRFVVSGGVIACHDYQEEGVRRAIHESLAEMGVAGEQLRHADSCMVYFKKP